MHSRSLSLSLSVSLSVSLPLGIGDELGPVASRAPQFAETLGGCESRCEAVLLLLVFAVVVFGMVAD